VDNNDRRQGIQHVLTWYSREDEKPVGERSLRKIGVEQLKVAFRPPEGDPLMYDSYPVGEEQAKFLGKALGISLHLERFDYFVECDTAGLPAGQ
jgi:hypothetical protein